MFFQSGVNKHDAISTSFELWFYLDLPGFTLIAAYRRLTGFILMLLTLPRLKLSNLVLPTMTSRLVFWTDPSLGTVAAYVKGRGGLGSAFRTTRAG